MKLTVRQLRRIVKEEVERGRLLTEDADVVESYRQAQLEAQRLASQVEFLIRKHEDLFGAVPVIGADMWQRQRLEDLRLATSKIEEVRLFLQQTHDQAKARAKSRPHR